MALDQRDKFRERASELVAARKTRDAQRATALEILQAYAAFDPTTQQAEIQKIWEDAARLKLFSDPTVLDLLKRPPAGITAAGLYAAEIGVYDLKDAARGKLLEIHLVTIRSLLKRN